MTSNIEYTYLDKQVDLDNLTKTLESVDRVAVDTEGDSLYHYFEKVCLIQLTFNDQNIIIDPLADLDLTAFIEFLPTKELYFHGGDFDLRMLKTHYNLAPPEKIFDTMLAAQLLGWDKLGLAALAEKIVGVNLPKANKKSDWSRRPLSLTQLEYAANDTRYLFTIADTLKKDLIKKGREGWLSDTTRALVKTSMLDRPEADPEREWRIKGVSRMSPRELALVRSIWYFRDAEARKSDLPSFKILGNQTIIELAINYSMRSVERLQISERLPRHFGSSRIEGLTQAIKKGLILSNDQLPERIKAKSLAPPGPEVELLRIECARLAEEYNIPASVLAPRAALEAISRHQAIEVKQITEVSKLLNWQAEIIQPAIKQIINIENMT